jgi:hypothetical protein
MRKYLCLVSAIILSGSSVAGAQESPSVLPDVSTTAKLSSISLDELTAEQKALEAIKQLDIQSLGLTEEDLKSMPPEQILLMAVEDRMKKELMRLDNLEPEIPSVFFDYAEHTQLRAVLGKSKTPIPDEQSSAAEDQESDITLLSNELSGQRDISLGGILFNGPEDWILWLNNQRLTPQRIPAQIKAINVTKSYVELRWYDDVSKQIVPIRLRPSQRFNLDARMFFPG